jgi:hypothetical protein
LPLVSMKAWILQTGSHDKSLKLAILLCNRLFSRRMLLHKSFLFWIIIKKLNNRVAFPIKDTSTLSFLS